MASQWYNLNAWNLFSWLEGYVSKRSNSVRKRLIDHLYHWPGAVLSTNSSLGGESH